MARSHHKIVSTAMALTLLATYLLLMVPARAQSPTEITPPTPPTNTEMERAWDMAASRPALASMPSPPGPQHLDPQANSILRSWSDFLVAADRFQVDVQTDVRIRGADLTTQLRSNYHLVGERPNRLALRPQKPDLDPTLICDGKTRSSLLPVAKQYTQESAPESFDRLLAGSSANILLAGGSALAHLTLLLARDPYDQLTILATDGRYLGTENVAGTPCHHVTVIQHYFEFDLWIETGPRPLLRKMVPTIVVTPQPTVASAPAAIPPPARQVGLENTLTLSNWSIGEPLQPDIFRFVPPPGTHLVESLLASSRTNEPNPLVDHPAPAFTVPLLDGSTFDLTAHKGRDVVVLDFWASWSSGSAERLPRHAKLASDYAGRPVVFLALNADDLERFARAFLEKNAIHLPVAIDQEATIAKLYHIRKLPQTILIDTEGRIRAIYTSLPANSDAALRPEIEKLLFDHKWTTPAQPTADVESPKTR